MKERLLKLRFIRKLIEGRGTVIRDEALCVICGLCAKSCPMEALTINRKSRTLHLDVDRCVRCGNCVKHCPKGALKIERPAEG